MKKKSLLGLICGATLVCTSQLILNPGKSIAEEKEGIVKAEQVSSGVFSITYKRHWEENYYPTHVYMVDCNRRIATFQGRRHPPLVSEARLIKICDI